MDTNLPNNQTDSEFDDISSFSSIDSYKPEPFVGPPSDDVNEHDDQSGHKLIKNDTVIHTGDDYLDDTLEVNNTISNMHTDTVSHTSGSTLKKLDSNAVERIVSRNAIQNNSETVESLKAQGFGSTRLGLPDVNSPITHTSGDAAFPDEYRIETTTGLVKMKTLQSLKKEITRGSNASDLRADSTSYHSAKSNKMLAEEEDPEVLQVKKINLAVERNQKTLEKYKKHKEQKGVKGFFNRLFD